MRIQAVLAIAMFAVLSIRCGGDPDGLSHPKLDQDYSSSFAGTWNGSATIASSGQPSQTTTAIQPIETVGFNRLSVAEMCTGVPGAAGIDSATSFSIDALTCKPTNASCGAITIRYDRGTGHLAQGTLTMTLEGNASGCGQSLQFTLTFTGTRAAGAVTRSFVALENDRGDFVGAEQRDVATYASGLLATIDLRLAQR
jgi:hypothetical protein